MSQLPLWKDLPPAEPWDNETWGSNDVSRSNTVVDSAGMAERTRRLGLGPELCGIYDNPNQGEFILFESFRIAYEGSLYTSLPTDAS